MAGSAIALPRVAFDVRPFEPDDMPFVTKTWMNNYKSSPRACDAGGCYDQEHRLRIHQLLGDPRITKRMAYVEGEPDAYLGFAVFDLTLPAPVIHYVYVRKEVRRHGIARSLLAGIDETKYAEMSHKLQMGGAWRGPSAFVYNPYRF